MGACDQSELQSTVVQETAFDVRSVAELSCAPNRAGTSGPLFLLNH